MKKTENKITTHFLYFFSYYKMLKTYKKHNMRNKHAQDEYFYGFEIKNQHFTFLCVSLSISFWKGAKGGEKKYRNLEILF
jgi:hypothetical protein